MNNITVVLEKILTSGIKDSSDFIQVKKVRMLNFISINTFTFYFLFSIFLYFYGIHLASLFCGIISLANLIGYLLIKNKHQKSAIYLTVSVNLIITNSIWIFYGRMSGAFFLMILWVSQSLLLFNNKKSRITIFILGTINYLFVEYYLDKFGSIYYLHDHFLYFSIVITCFVYLYWMLDYLMIIHREYQNELIKQNKDLNKYYTAIEQNQSVVVITDTKGIIEYTNPQFEKTTGYSYSDSIGKHTRLLKSNKQNDEFYKILWDTISSGNVWSGNFINRKKNREEYIERAIITPLKDENNNIINYIAIKEDITELYNAENQLKENNQLLQQLIDSLPAIIYVKDINLKYKFVNKNFVYITHPSQNNVIDYSANDIFNHNLATVFDELDNLILEKQKPIIEFEADYLDQDNNRKWILTSKIPFFNGKEELQGIIGIVQDITERKESEILLKNMNTKLEESETKLKESLATKDKFFSIISHDLRGPFSGILGLSEILYNEINTFTQDEILEIIKNLNQTSKSTFNLLNNLLDWARIQTGAIQIFLNNYNINLILTETIELLKNQSNQKSIEIIYNPNDYFVYIDFNLIHTVVRNLLNNAIKFTPRNGKIEIGFDEYYSFNKIKVYIKDNGVGINESDLNNIFKLNKKTSQKGTDNEPGTGLGLILCKEFIEINKGEIWVESELEKGSTFYFTLLKKK